VLTRRRLLQGLAGIAASGFSLGAYAVGIEPLMRLDVARYAITPPGWPEGLKLRIVALADIHACEPWMPTSRVAAIVDQANGLGADLIVLLGDFVGTSRLLLRKGSEIDWSSPLRSLRAPLGVHAILGNHDWWDDEEALSRQRGPTFVHRGLSAIGIPVLENSAVRLRHADRDFWLCGLGDQIAFQPVRRSRRRRVGVDDLPRVLAALTDDAPAILLAHEPDIWPEVPNRVALTLSGHTHGGQVNIFGWRPAHASELSDRYSRGHFREAGRDLVVSSGIGCSVAPVRFGVPPEIMVIELGG
jgi:uncharacterized protein